MSSTKVTHNEDTVVIYTDGACSGNPGPGGWAWAVSPSGTPRGSGGENPSTNQRMEIMAAFHAVQTFYEDPRRIVIVSDSNYVVKCFNDGWWRGWHARGWKNSQRQPVANRDLWEPFIDLVNTRGNVDFAWVKGHSGDPMNDLVDSLAVDHTVAR
jgi:ribonuclease HI